MLTPRILFQITGIAAVLGGLGVLGSYALTEERKRELPLLEWWAYRGNNFLLLLGFFGVYLFQADESGLWGLAGFLLVGLGAAITTYEGRIAGQEGYVAGSAILALGTIALSVATWVAGIFPPWLPALWIVSILVGLPGMFIKSYQTLGYLLGGLPFSAGLIAAGAILLTRLPT